MWTKIQSQADVNKLRPNSRLLKFTGDGTPQDPPPDDPSYTLFMLHQNADETASLSKSGQNPLFKGSFRANPVAADDDTTSTASLSKSGQNPLFKGSFTQAGHVQLPVPAEEMIEEGIWWL